MSGDGFHVSTEELRTHSESVDAIAEGGDEAAQAASTERAGGLVYGVFFDAFLPVLNWWADRLHGLIAQDAGLGHSIAEGIASNADTYDGIEQANANHLTRTGEIGD
jgi:hypothetical protein